MPYPLASGNALTKPLKYEKKDVRYSMVHTEDATLTTFLIRSFSGIFEGTLKPVKKPTIPGTRQFYHRENGLTYLETSAGTIYRSRTDISIHYGEENTNIWYMSIFSDVNQDALAKSCVSAFDLRQFLLSARQIGFLETLDAIRKNESYCLFDIPEHAEPAPVTGKGEAGTLEYHETINDNLDKFRGEELIRFRGQSNNQRADLYRASIHGGRL